MKKIIHTLLLKFLILLVFASLAISQKRTVKVLGLSVEGNSSADANMVRISAGISPGTEATGDDIQEAIKQLWSLGLFEDIKIVLDREVTEGVYLTIQVKEYPHLEKVELEGNKKLKKDDIDEVLNFYPGQVISPGTLARARKKLKDKYKEKGYLLAEINTETFDSKEKEGRAIVRITIDEGKKVQIKRITFYGNEAFKESKLCKQMKETKEDRWWRGADFDKKKYQEDLGKVVEFYNNEGFRDAEILRDSLYYGPERDDMYIDIWLVEGRKYTFGQITWEGNDIYSNEELEAQLRIEPGDVYSKEKLDKAVFERIGELYYNRGYIYATTSPKEIPRDNNTVDLHFQIHEGKQANVNQIEIKGNTKTKEKVIRRELRILPGDTFNRDLLQRSQREVWMLNYFSNVEPKIVPVGEDKVDVEFVVEEKSTDTANMSAGWSERDKMIGSIGVSMANLFGNGQHLSFSWNFGYSYRSFEISFSEPWLMDTPTLAGFSFYDLKREPTYTGYRQRSRGGSFRLGRRFRWPDNFFRGDWIYRIDQTELSDFHSSLRSSGYFEQYEKWGALLSSSVTQIISRNSLDRPEFPTSGSDVSLTTEIAGTVLGGNVDYYKNTLRMDWFFPSVWKLVLHAGFQAGYLEGFSKDTRIPYLEYFFMGGDGLSRSIPLRGYEDPMAGYASEPGGKSMLKYTAEIRIPIAPNPTIFGLIFAEAGNTWADFKSADPFSLRRSVGIGGRVFMPMIGIIGFDYGYGFDNIDPNTGKVQGKWKPHFVFGKSF